MLKQDNATHLKKGAHRIVDIRFRQTQQRLPEASIALEATDKVLENVELPIG